jgi:PAS domain S-box-containing protein
VFGLGLISGLAAFLAGELGWLAGLDARAYDLAIRNRPPLPRSERIAIIEIDDLAIRRLGRWPWPWSRHAEFVRNLQEDHGPAVVAFDLLFAEQDPSDPQHEFAGAVRETGNVYLAAFFTDTGDTGSGEPERPRLAAEYSGNGEWKGKRFASYRPPAKALAEAAAGVGPVNVIPELDGCLRRVPLVLDHNGKPYVSLAGVVVNALRNPERRPVRVMLGEVIDFGGFRVPVDNAGETLVSYTRAAQSGAVEAFERYQYEDVLLRRLPRGELRGKVVLVGFGATGMADVRPTPLTGGMLGVEVNAHALNGILRGSFVRVAGWPARLLFALALALVVGAVVGVLSPGLALAGGAAAALGCFGAVTAVLWYRGVWLGAAAPLVAAAGSYGISVWRLSRDRERDWLRTRASVDTLARVTRVIGSVRQRSELLEEIRAQVNDIMGGRQTNLYLRNEGEERLALAAPGDAQVSEVSHALGEGTVGWVAQYVSPHLVARVEEGSSLRQELARVARFPVGSAVYGPMHRRGEPMGVIEVLRGVGEEPFGAQHLAILGALTGECAVALENMRLYEQLEGKVDIANRQLVAAYGELKQERDRVAAIVSNMADGVVVTDAERQIAFMNPAACQMFGVDEEEVTGRPAAQVLPFAVLLEQLEGRAPESPTQIPRIRLGEPRRLTLSPRTVVLRDEEGGRIGSITVVSDITLLEELSEMKSEFVSVVSHELRSPLTSIMGFAQTLQGHGQETPVEVQDEYLGIIQQESNRLLVMINDLLDVSRMEAGRALSLHYAEVDLRSLVEHVVRFQQVTTDRHQFKVELPDNGLSVEADRDKVEQILTNLVSNAIKYSPKGGEVVIGGSEEGDYVVLHVADQGLGMREEEVAQLFQPYQRVDRDAIKGIRGTGLGLHLVRGLVEAHGGKIWVESAPGKGSTFRFSLPKRPEREAVV